MRLCITKKSEVANIAMYDNIRTTIYIYVWLCTVCMVVCMAMCAYMAMCVCMTACMAMYECLRMAT